MRATQLSNSPGIRLPVRSGPWPLAIALAAGFVSPAAAQDAQPVCRDGEARIVGVVIDAVTEAPLARASVSVAKSDWQSLTTDSGRFLLCEIGGGPHLLTAERLGYRTVTAPVVATASGDPLRVRMQADPIVLEGWAELQSIPTAQLYMVEVYGRGRHIRAYSHAFMQRAAKIRLLPMSIWQ